MTKLEELLTDLETHEKRFAQITAPNYKSKFVNVDPAFLIDSYKRIIASLKKEIKEIKDKKRAKKKAKAAK